MRGLRTSQLPFRPIDSLRLHACLNMHFNYRLHTLEQHERAAPQTDNTHIIKPGFFWSEVGWELGGSTPLNPSQPARIATKLFTCKQLHIYIFGRGAVYVCARVVTAAAPAPAHRFVRHDALPTAPKNITTHTLNGSKCPPARPPGSRRRRRTAHTHTHARLPLRSPYILQYTIKRFVNINYAFDTHH